MEKKEVRIGSARPQNLSVTVSYKYSLLPALLSMLGFYCIKWRTAVLGGPHPRKYYSSYQTKPYENVASFPSLRSLDRRDREAGFKVGAQKKTTYQVCKKNYIEIFSTYMFPFRFSYIS